MILPRWFFQQNVYDELNLKTDFQPKRKKKKTQCPPLFLNTYTDQMTTTPKHNDVLSIIFLVTVHLVGFFSYFFWSKHGAGFHLLTN